mmetsp:Transcript_12816/g.34713  ORF Transcript_12816/g.34713 Transcript_12816/m.34713 type:complete len:208 (+) Transcript_12816:468-1091(+)
MRQLLGICHNRQHRGCRLRDHAEACVLERAGARGLRQGRRGLQRWPAEQRLQGHDPEQHRLGAGAGIPLLGAQRPVPGCEVQGGSLHQRLEGHQHGRGPDRCGLDAVRPAGYRHQRRTHAVLLRRRREPLEDPLQPQEFGPRRCHCGFRHGGQQKVLDHQEQLGCVLGREGLLPHHSRHRCLRPEHHGDDCHRHQDPVPRQQPRRLR